jgi:integral membrane sensor domain MASE1
MSDRLQDRLQERGWAVLTLLGTLVGLFIGLAIAPELPVWMPWALGIGAVVAFAAVLIMKRFRKPDQPPH